MRKLILFLIAACAFAQTTVTDTVSAPGGTRPSGTMRITATRPFISTTGHPVAANVATVVTVTSGLFSVNLWDTPSGYSYSVTYLLPTGSYSETWVVPVSGSALGLSSVRVASVPSPTVTVSLNQLTTSGATNGQCPVYSTASLHWLPGNCGVSSVTTGGTNGVIYRDSSGTLLSTATGGAGTLCLTSVAGAAPSFGSCAGAASTNFSDLVTSTNSTATMTVGTGASITTSGSGVNNANQINGVALSGLATGILKNTTSTGAPSIAVAGDFPTLNQSTSGNAATATALAANPANCSSGNLPRGITAAGVAEGCAAVDLTTEVTGVLPNANTTAASANTASAIVARDASGNFVAGAITANLTGAVSGNASTATALAANGTNCTAGQFPLGVDASGASESCTALPTTISGTANQITASAATGAVTLSIPTNPTLPGTTTGTFSGNLTGTASLASALTPGRTINGTAFDGTVNITVTAAAGTLTGNTLASGVTASSLTSLGTIATGVWQGTKVGLAYGGSNADLSATGGTSQVLKQVSTGAAVTVGQLACADLSDASATCATAGVPTSRTVSTSSPLGGGGALSGNLTLTCATCVTSAASLTSTAFMTGAGSQASQTPSGTSTLDGSGNASFAGTVTAAGGFATGATPPTLTSGTGGAQAFTEGTNPSACAATGVDCLVANSTQHGFLASYNNGSYLPLVQGPASQTTGNVVSWNGTNGGLVADAGFLATNVVRKDTSNTFGTGGTLDLSGSTSVSALRVANIAGAAPTVAGVLSYDTTNKNLHVGANSVDTIAGLFLASALPANDDCIKASVSSSVVRLVSAGAACGSGGSATPGGSNTQIQYNNSSAFGGMAEFTYASSTITASSSGILDLSAASVTAGLKIPSAAGAAPTADGFIAKNTTTHALVHGVNGTANVVATAATGTNTATTCTSQVVTVISSVAVPTCTTLTSAFMPVRTATVSLLDHGSIFLDNSGDVDYEPYSILATNDFWYGGVFRFGANNAAAPTVRSCIGGMSSLPWNVASTVTTAAIVPVWTSTITTNAVVWDFDYRIVGGDDTTSLDQTTATETLTVTDTAPGAANRRMTPSITATAANFSGTGGQTLQWNACRDGVDAADTLAGSALLVDLQLQVSTQ